jgi:hypothetical protein
MRTQRPSVFRLTLVFAAAVALTAANVVQALPPAPARMSTSRSAAADLELVGQISGPFHAVTVQGTDVYVGVGLRLFILDATDPTHPIVVGHTPHFGGIVEDVVVEGTYAYVVDDRGGLHVIGISNPHEPTVVGFYDVPEEASGLAVAGGYAYIVDDSFGNLRILDVSDPTSPRPVGFYVTPGSAQDVAVRDSHAYVADGEAGLLILDISTPAAPRVVSNYAPAGSVRALALAGDYAYVVGDWDFGLRIVDVTDPANPTEAGFVRRSSSAIAVAGDYAYISVWDGLVIVDISHPASPTEIATQPIDARGPGRGCGWFPCLRGS